MRLKLSLIPIIVGSALLVGDVSESSELEQRPGSQSEIPAKQTTTQEQEAQAKFQTSLLEILRTMANQNKTAYEQGRADEKSWKSPSVLVNIVLILVGIAYTIFAALQWRTICRQADIANRALALTNRPRIKIRALSVSNDVFSSGKEEIRINYEAVNCGGTDAILIDSNCTIWLKHVNDKLPMSPPYEMVPFNRIDEPGRVFRAGELYRFCRNYTVPSEQDLDFGIGNMTVHLLGFINYRGSIGSQHRTAFCRNLRVEQRTTPREGKQLIPLKFETVNDPDYEYED